MDVLLVVGWRSITLGFVANQKLLCGPVVELKKCKKSFCFVSFVCALNVQQLTFGRFNIKGGSNDNGETHTIITITPLLLFLFIKSRCCVYICLRKSLAGSSLPEFLVKILAKKKRKEKIQYGFFKAIEFLRILINSMI
jgi:hypothetical protein